MEISIRHNNTVKDVAVNQNTKVQDLVNILGVNNRNFQNIIIKRIDNSETIATFSGNDLGNRSLSGISWKPSGRYDLLVS